MDPVGGVAAIVALVSTAISASKVGVSLVQAIRDAPQELLAAVSTVQVIQCQLEQLSQIGMDIHKNHQQLPGMQTIEVVQSTLEVSKHAFAKLQNALPSTSLQSGIRSRVRWAILERNIANKHLQRLRHIQQDLGLAFQILDMRIALHFKDSMMSLCEAQNRLSITVGRVQQTVMEMNMKLPQQEYNVNFYTRTNQAFKLDVVGHTWYLRTISFSSIDKQRFNAINLTLLLPSLLGRRAITAQILLKWFESSVSSCQLLRGLLCVKYVVPDESRIMTACAEGDVPTVQNLTSSEKGSARDITRAGRTPLLYAVKSGNCDLVELLIDNGADVNLAYGYRSPLQLAAQCSHLSLARVLLCKGAWADHTDAAGWTAAFYLWSFRRIQMPSQTSFIKILNMDGGCTLGALGRHNWSALHRAAAFGTAGDIQTLIQYGADPRICTDGLEWNPTHHAAFFSNETTLRELLDPKNCLNVNASDVRGWTLLHIAAAVGKAAVLALLLESGADPWRLTKPTSFHVREAFRGRSLTALEIAEESGLEQRDVYLQALENAGLKTRLPEKYDA